MTNHFGYIIISLLVLSCTTSKKEEKSVIIVDGTKTHDVYQGSEMTTLMQGMYAYHLQLKKDIQLGEQPDEFPEVFLNIHSAQLSETKTRNEIFDFYTTQFIEAEKLIFVDDSLTSNKERYNNAIGMCIACHKSECTGPIPKIKKLLIP